MAFAAAACVGARRYNNLVGVQPWHGRWYPAVNACAAAAALAAAAASGLTAADLGLTGTGCGPGSGWARRRPAGRGRVRLAALTPATRPLLNDQRIASLTTRARLPDAARHPRRHRRLGRDRLPGVLQAALRRVLSEPAATAVTSATFGLWHIRPTAEALPANRLARTRGARIVAVTAVAAGTAAAARCCPPCADAPAAWPRRVLHLAANGTAPLAVALARALAAKGCRANRSRRLPATPPDPVRSAGRTRARSRAGG